MPTSTVSHGYRTTTYESGSVVVEITSTPVEAAAPRVWERNEFIALFTPQEWHDAKELAKTDIDGEQLMDFLTLAPYVKEDSPQLQRGLLYYAAKGITKRTPAQILEGVYVE